MKFNALPGSLAIARLAPNEPSPSWASGPFVSITRTDAETSVVCEESSVPSGLRADRGWRALQIEGPLPLSATGIAAEVTGLLAAAGISVFMVATFDTDYVLVKSERFDAACEVLRAAGHAVPDAAARFTITQGAQRQSFADDVREGLRAHPKHLSPWYFYDALGSALFDAICELPEYYVTRAEIEILTHRGADIARAFGSIDRLIELGSGSCRKTALLLEPVLHHNPRLRFVPVDIDPSVLHGCARDLQTRFPALRIDAVCGDYRDAARLVARGGRSAALFLGSSIGNLDMESAAAMLHEVRSMLATGDPFLLGADLRKPKEILEPAYDDALGVTAAFNKNLLARINRELGGTFDLTAFDHRAFFNESESRIEMHLVSRARQSVRIESLGMTVEFEDGETIHTENSYKYAESDLRQLAARSGFEVTQIWTDSKHRFADVLCVAAGVPARRARENA